MSNGPLPNPRLISTMVHKDESHDTEQFTMFVMQWGQFVDHDLTSTPQTRSVTTHDHYQCEDHWVTNVYFQRF